MLILFDHETPAPLRLFLTGHTVKKAKDLGWDTLINGELLKAAEAASFQVFITTDKTSDINRIYPSTPSRSWSWVFPNGQSCVRTWTASWPR
jgi:hypothetical protein